ncbi:MAG: glutamate--tRNA ligase [Desulfovibrio sp.]|nr:glutamate--tRNA ligase [Desulfovibrio sp.]
MSITDPARLTPISSLDEAERLFPERDLPSGAEVVRIAPSPTGFPHIGTAMQAVINAALARKSGGVFLLRIEDTDRARLVPGAEEAIHQALRWLGVVPDEGPGPGGAYGPYRQSERLSLYALAARSLVAGNLAYHCFCPAERLAAVREGQIRAGENPRYDRFCLGLKPEEVEARHRAGEKSVIRFRVPEGAEIVFRDEVRGDISFSSEALDDSILLKADGFPTYHLAVVVDDHFMRVTTVVRGEEWISSTPKHVLLYRAFGWKHPRFLHTVILRDEQRRKLSKRSGHISIRWFRSRGYLPEGFRNFLTRILWAHPGEKDVYDFSEFIELFSVQALPRTGPIVDLRLLDFINGKYLSRLSPAEMRRGFLAYLDFLDQPAEEQIAGLDFLPPPQARHALGQDLENDAAFAEQVFALEPERNRKFSDVFGNNGFFFPSAFTPAAPESLLRHCPDAGLARGILCALLEGEICRPSPEDWDAALRKVAEEFGVKPKALFMLLRLAVTGLEKTPPLHNILLVLGNELARKRVAGALASLPA